MTKNKLQLAREAIKLATTTNITTTYAGEFAGLYIGTALFASPTVFNDGISVRQNVKYKEVIKRVTHDGIIKNASCDFNPTSTITLDERILQPKELQVNLQFCKDTFQSDWESIAMGFSAWDNMPPKFTEFILARVAEVIAEQTERDVWQGLGAQDGQFEGFEPLFRADATVIDVGTPGAIDATNVIDEMGAVAAAIPKSVYRAIANDLKMYVATNVWKSYVTALGGFGANGLGANGFQNLGTNNALGVSALTFGGIEVFHAPGLTDGSIVAAQKSNLFFGTGLLSDYNEVRILDMASIDLSQNVRVAARYTAGVQYGFGNEIVYRDGAAV